MPLMEFPTLSTKMIVCREWEENTGVEGGRGAAVLVLAIITQAARWRAFPLPSRMPYVFEGVDEGGRWYNGSRRTDGRRGLSVTHVWTSQHNGNPFFGLRTDRQIRRRPTSPWKSPVRVRLRNNKTTAAPVRRRQRQNSATLRLTVHWSSGALEVRRTRGFWAMPRSMTFPDEFRGSPTAKIDLISELTLNNSTRQCVAVGREVSYYKLRQYGAMYCRKV